jgi:3-oxoacyl-(acyl-carrier-protein) synthase
VQALNEALLPPTLNLDEPDAECELALLQRAQSTSVEAVMSLSYGFGGHIGVLIFEKAD